LVNWLYIITCKKCGYISTEKLPESKAKEMIGANAIIGRVGAVVRIAYFVFVILLIHLKSPIKLNDLTFREVMYFSEYNLYILHVYVSKVDVVFVVYYGYHGVQWLRSTRGFSILILEWDQLF
jgi:hypothetical protein